MWKYVKQKHSHFIMNDSGILSPRDNTDSEKSDKIKEVKIAKDTVVAKIGIVVIVIAL